MLNSLIIYQQQKKSHIHHLYTILVYNIPGHRTYNQSCVTLVIQEIQIDVTQWIRSLVIFDLGLGMTDLGLVLYMYTRKQHRCEKSCWLDLRIGSCTTSVDKQSKRFDFWGIWRWAGKKCSVCSATHLTPQLTPQSIIQCSSLTRTSEPLQPRWLF